ncbi:MAG: hypothetical protein IKQ41_07590 [Clostridia bacterium]|nr:hypothetical protein [Clostridia bacterium]
MRKAYQLLLCIALLVSFAGLAESDSIPAPGPDISDNGRRIKDESNTALGVSVIADPVPPENKDTPWSGNYVWFGVYDGKPIRFRVLAKDAAAYPFRRTERCDGRGMSRGFVHNL